MGKPGLGKRIASCFSRQVLEKYQSAFLGEVEVVMVFGRVMVDGPSVNYGFGPLDTVFREAFRKIRLDSKKWKDVLLLGLGAGNVPHILRNDPRDWNITAVEIDPVMVEIGRKWFHLDDFPKLDIQVRDADAFVREMGNRAYDLVIVDLFVDAKIPSFAEQENFLKPLGACLRPGGMLMFNRLAHSPELEADTDSFERKMKNILPGTRSFTAHTNRMLVYEKA